MANTYYTVQYKDQGSIYRLSLAAPTPEAAEEIVAGQYPQSTDHVVMVDSLQYIFDNYAPSSVPDLQR